MSPVYLAPMLRMPGLLFLGGASLSISAGIATIMKMVRIDI
jgi:hypothetical protein